MSVSAHIAAQRTDHGVPHAVSCRALGVAPSTFYKWHNRPPTPAKRRRAELDAGVKACFDASGGTYGSPRRLLSNSGRGARVGVGGCGRIGGMQGTEKPDRELLDALGLCGALVREGSVYRFLAEHRLRLFGDGLFADLFGGRGRPSVPGSVIAVVMVLQALEGCSDREAVERLRCDVRWKAAAGLGIDAA